MSSEEAGLAPAPEPSRDLPSRTAVRLEQARLYARLLVNDIRLYHEEDVIVGRARGDLVRRLRESVADARARFLRRFEDEALFEAELVRILAGGEARRLG